MNDLTEFSVPATCANLGPGFGVLAIALDLPLQVTVQRGGIGHHVERRGTVQEMRMDARHDAILRGLHSAAEHWKIKLPADLHIVADSRIPPASGLGTHSASFAAGIGAALRLAKARPDVNEVLDLLVELGGDPGHGAAALVGGFTAVCQTSAPGERLSFRILRKPLHESWRFVLACPEARISTADTRRVLPPSLPHAVTPRTSSRLLGLLDALEHGDEDLLGAFLFDEVHVPFRRRLAAGMEEAMVAGRQAGAAGVTISGHGPGIVALTTNEDACRAIGEAMAAAFTQAGQLAEIMYLRATSLGALPL